MRVGLLGGNGFLGRRIMKMSAECGIVIACDSAIVAGHKGELSEWLSAEGIEIVINCAARVGGIKSGEGRQLEVFNLNERIMTSVVESVIACGVKRLISPISNCVYPAKYSKY